MATALHHSTSSNGPPVIDGAPPGITDIVSVAPRAHATQFGHRVVSTRQRSRALLVDDVSGGRNVHRLNTGFGTVDMQRMAAIAPDRQVARAAGEAGRV